MTVLLFFAGGSLWAQPSNDDYANAIDLTALYDGCSADAVYTTFNATPDLNAGVYWNNGGPRHNVWFSFIAPATGEMNITIDIDGVKGTQRNTQVAIWDSDGITEVHSERYTNANDDIIIGSPYLVPAQTYYISVDVLDTASTGTFTICLDDTIDYDYLEGAIDVDPLFNTCSADAAFTTEGATPDLGEGSSSPNIDPIHNRWFRFVAPASGSVNITVETGGIKGTQQGTELNLWKEDGISELFSVSVSGSGNPVIGATGLEAGKIHYISVDVRDAASRGTFTLCLTAGASSDLRISKDIDNPTLVVGSTYVFTVRVENAGPADMPAGTIVNDDLENGFTYVSDNGGGAYNSTTGDWTLPAILFNDFVELEMTVTANGSGSYRNNASITSAPLFDPNLANNTISRVVSAPAGGGSDNDGDLTVDRFDLDDDNDGIQDDLECQNSINSRSSGGALASSIQWLEFDGAAFSDLTFDSGDSQSFTSANGDVLTVTVTSATSPANINTPIFNPFAFYLNGYILNTTTSIFSNTGNATYDIAFSAVDFGGAPIAANIVTTDAEGSVVATEGLQFTTNGSPWSILEDLLTNNNVNYQIAGVGTAVVDLTATDDVTYGTPLLLSNGVTSMTLGQTSSSGSQAFILGWLVDPVPCVDTDNDGVVNSLDLDSDNDGIYDAVEAGHGAALTNGVVDGASGSDGIPNAVQAGPESGNVNYGLRESSDDTDTILDFLDLDSDGDGIPDNVEAQPTLGYIAQNADNSTNYISNRGVNSAYLGGLDPVHSDSDRIADYRDTNADDESADDTTEAALTLTGLDDDNDGLDNATDATVGYDNPGGTVESIVAGAVQFPDYDGDKNLGGDGDVDYRDTIDDTLDADNDTVSDYDDFDDDNDGIFDVIECGDPPSYTNQSFEEGVVPGNATNTPGPSPAFFQFSEADVPGWETTAPDNEIEIWESGHLGIDSYAGNYHAEINSTFDAALFQEYVSSPGEFTSISFAHRGRSGVDTIEIFQGPPGGPYQSLGQYATGLQWEVYHTWFIVPAGQTLSEIRFQSVSTATGDQAVGNLLDDIYIYEGCYDTDADGVLNGLDLDSDNDGLYDAFEAGHGQPTTNGVVNGGVGTNGIPDAVETAPDNTIPNYTVLESALDTDNIEDYKDQDSDGDGIPDNVEVQTTQGYIPLNADNLATYQANDGVNTAYLGGLTPVNTDLADTPDYLDLDSDNEGGDDTTEAGITLIGTDPDEDGLDSATDATPDGADPGGTIDSPIAGALLLPDFDNDATTSGDVDFRDATDDSTTPDEDGDGIPNVDEDDNTDGDNDPTTDPTDTDDDGVPNYLDLDADNDGIYDVVEAGHGAPHTNGIVDGPRGTDGIPDAVQDPGQENSGVVNYTVAESSDDIDTNPDFLDLDADGDHIPDNVEAQTTIGYIAPNADNAATYLSNDGINSAYLGGLAPVNTDGADNPDYLDRDSDNEGGNDTTEARITPTGVDADGDGLDDAIDTDLTGYGDPAGIIDAPLASPFLLSDVDNDASSGGDVDFRDTTDERPDNDNDGIVDAVDYDDDNDGIMDIDESCGNLIINDSFEQQDFTDPAEFPGGLTGPNGTFIGTTYNTNELTGWTYTQNVDGWVETGGFPPLQFAEAYHGTQYIDVMGNDNVTGGVTNILSQTVTLVQGQTYIFSFFWGEDVGARAGDTVIMDMDVIDANGAAIYDETLTTIATGIHDNTYGPNSWYYVERTFIATTDDITVQFTTTPPARNTAVGVSLDGVVLINSVATDCADTDGDGVIDAFDLDSDNDGIYDAVEAGHGQAHTNGIVNGAVGEDGIPDAVQETGKEDRTGIGYVVAESTDDVDTLPDFLDLDSDGDGLPDNVEAQTTLGYVVSNADNAAAYLANDGVNSAYLGGLSPVNTDAADNPDYLDTDSDNEGGDDSTEAEVVLAGSDTDGDGLDDATDGDNTGYADPGGTIDDPLTNPIRLLDSDNDVTSGGDVDFRDPTEDRLDNDNDGIVDTEDYDGDNDGIPDIDEGCGNLIVNGSFEQQDFTDAVEFPGGFTASGGTFIGNTYNTNTLTGWDYTQNVDGWVGGASFPPRSYALANHGGQYVDILGNNNVTGGVSNVLSQTVTLVPGETYTFSFNWGEDVGHFTGESFFLDMDVIDSNANAIFDETLTAVAEGNVGNVLGPKTWYYEERTFTATTETITFQFTTTPIARNTAVGATLDNVVLVNSSTNACRDTDNDGVIDAFDLDSDNDGIYDAVEAGHGQAHTNGIVNGAVGEDGIPDAVQETGKEDRTGIGYTLAESSDDTDTIPDFLDLDADGDGIPDNIEAQTTLGYVVSNADNAAAYLANDGVNSAYLGGLNPVNTDVDAIPDYLDLNSDQQGNDDTNEAAITLTGIDSDNDGLDDAVDATPDYSVPGGTINNPITGAVQLPDFDGDVALAGGDVDYRDAIDNVADTDLDGIVDFQDLDDDNDGILDVIECGNPPTYFNQSFEEGVIPANANFISLATPTYYLFDEADVPAWETTAPDGQIEIWESGHNGVLSHSGNYHAEINAVFEAALFQSYNSNPGEFTSVTFAHRGRTGVDVIEIFQGPPGGPYRSLGQFATDQEWMVYKTWFIVPPGQTTTEIRFEAISTAGGDRREGNLLDSIFIYEGCNENDGDNVEDGVDLDSDNDGIYDAVEAGHGAPHTNGVVDGAVGADGIPDILQAPGTEDGGAVTHTELDSDGDGRNDYVSLDSDADGCNDVTEAGYTDNNANGFLGDAPESVDVNGLVTSGTDGYTEPEDRDTNGIFEYREVGSTAIITDQPVATSVCAGTDVLFSTIATNADVYQWQFFDGTGWIDLTDAGIYTGTATDMLIITPTIAENGARYRVLVSNVSYSCEDISDEVTLAVEASPALTIGDASITEGGDMIVPITLSGPTCMGQDITLTFAFTDVTTDGTDYTNTPVQLTIPSGQLTAELIVPTTDDTIDEPDETFTISVASVDFGALSDSSDTAIGTITDDDNAPDIDSDDDGILDSFEDLNTDGDNDPSTDATNSDGDLYPDYLDIDSDNDGIPDNVEAQATDGYIPPSGLDANANGLDDAYEMGVRMGLVPINTDGEDFPDYLDVDSDNDNVPDAIEGHDGNADGIADVSVVGSDKDDDGLDDGYEGAIQIDTDVNDEIDEPLNDLPDTDGDGTLDYRDTDDDNDQIPTREEDGNLDGNYANDDIDADGTPDYLEPNYPEVEVFNAVTPNDDGVHDYLIITGLDIRPNNSIQIFNRWGTLIYETKAYDTTGNRFDGTSQGRGTVGKGDRLPSGTYFYILNFEDFDTGFKTLSGYLYLN